MQHAPPTTSLVEALHQVPDLGWIIQRVHLLHSLTEEGGCLFGQVLNDGLEGRFHQHRFMAARRHDGAIE